MVENIHLIFNNSNYFGLWDEDVETIENIFKKYEGLDPKTPYKILCYISKEAITRPGNAIIKLAKTKKQIDDDVAERELIEKNTEIRGKVMAQMLKDPETEGFIKKYKELFDEYY